MFGWFKRVPKPSPKRLIDLETQLSDVEVTIHWLKKAVVDLNARMAAIARQKKAADDAPGSTIDAGPGTDAHAPRAVAYDRPFPNSRRGF